MPERRQTDVDVARIFFLGLGLVGIVLVVAVLTHFSLGRVSRSKEPGAQRRSPLAREALPPEPRLQTSPAGDMEALRARERAVLETYGWVDRAHGIVHVPIDEAKKMILKQELPDPMKRRVLPIAMLIFFGLRAGARAQVSGALAPATAQPAGAASPALADVLIEQRLDSQLPLDAPFRDEGGRSVRLGTYFGSRPVVFAFVYFRCPMLCTYVLNGTVRTLRALSFTPGQEFELVAISIDPADTPREAAAKKKEFLAEYGRASASAGVHFLTGEKAAIERVTRASGFRFAEDRETGGFSHAAGLLLSTPGGRMARYFYGLEYSARDLRLSIVEASRGKIGSPVDRVLLYCSHYDPTTGKYGWVVLRIIRLAGAATVVLLGGFMLVMFRRERKPR